MKCVIHVGMHKTGSTSIQGAISQLDSPDFQYLTLDNPNHSVALRTLFGEEPLGHPRLRFRGYDKPSDVDSYRIKWLAHFEEQIKHADRTLVISGEDLSLEGNSKILKNLKAALSVRFDEFQVIAYVRRPVSYTESAFQEVIKNGGAFFRPELHFPKYKQRFESLEDIFGPAAVTYVLFDRNVLSGQDVVSDFYHRVGISQAPKEVIDDNQSLNLAALSVIYKNRKINSAKGALTGVANSKLVLAARHLEGPRFHFGDNIVAPLLEAYRGEIEWMEQRLGVSLHESIAPEGACESEQDLFKWAESQVEPLRNAYLKVSEDKSLEPAAFSLLASARSLPSKDGSNDTSVFTDAFTAECRKAGLPSHVALRETALAFNRLGFSQLASHIIDQALSMNPQGEALKKVKKIIAQ
ncbi:hypothetical protein [Marinobacter sp. LV10MA510-1]|uniref:hypothetical protein n=1 Tax=Marinobacter sp. LV10MA510-1 TaxID=1415567 RepID=UPI000BF83B21|nr:hypothetical protein [Marinobacter sp. LV10MA510-1]PFG08967.1 hypothetical protein ATI45_1308 [Marinobacter sp. LV10MA510-1]